MQLKIIQINIYRGKFLDKLVEFLQSEQPDIVTMQEVTGGVVNFWHDQSIDTFQYVKDALGLQGVVAPMYRLTGDEKSYEGNAVLVRGKILNTKIAWLKEYCEYGHVPWEKEGPELPRNVLDVTVTFSSPVSLREIPRRGTRGFPPLPEGGRGGGGSGDHTIHILTTHGAWTKAPIDTPEKVRQARMLAKYIRDLGDEPFVLGGDFNMEPGSEVIRTIDAVARNAVYGSAIKNTLNLRTHRAAAKLGKGRLVDFIYTSPHFRVESIDAPEVDVSDHLPVRAVLTLTRPAVSLSPCGRGLG